LNDIGDIILDKCNIQVSAESFF